MIISDPTRFCVLAPQNHTKGNLWFVNVFRQSQFAPSIVKEAVSIGAKAMWLQDGVISDEAYTTAKNAGLLFVMNDCMLRRHRQLF